MRFCPLFSGSSGNSLYIEAGNVRLLVDAGLPGRTISAALSEVALDARGIDGILITHEHSDHISGVGVLARRYHIPVYANEGTWNVMEHAIGPIAPSLMRTFETGRDFFIGETNILPFATPHDASESVGFAIDDGMHKLSVMTDIGHVNTRMLDAVRHSELLLIESNHDVEMLKVGPYPYPLKRRILGEDGHLSNENAGHALASLFVQGLRRAVLGHLSRDNNTEALAYETVRAVLRDNDIPDNMFEVTLAHRSRIGLMYDFEDIV